MEVDNLHKINYRFYLCFKLTVAAAALCIICIVSGCSSELLEPLDIGGLYYEYSLVSETDEKYIVLTKHLVSESDVKIPDTIYDVPVKKIGESVFSDDQRIKNITLGKNVEIIGSNAFGGCTSLENIQFTENVTNIESFAFKNCTSLKEVNIPQNVQSVGRGAFYGCSSLGEIGIPENLRNIGGRAFANTAWLNEKNQREFIIVGDGVLIQYNGDETEIKIPRRAKIISGAFAGNTDIESVSLNSEVRIIGDMAFMGCTSLKSVNIPDSVTEIGQDAFYGCGAMNSVSLSQNIERIGKNAFDYCGADLYLQRNSAAHKYCAENNIEYRFYD